MAHKGRSEPNISGGYTHYDEHGKKTGSSEPNLFGGYTNYDAKGHKTGTSDPNLFGGYTNRDAKGRRTGYSDPGLFGGYTHRDSGGKKTGRSEPSLFGGFSNEDEEACYIATCVYGSYDCPEVWTLRRFRDNTLAKTVFGRCLIRTYYAVGPGIVAAFGSRRSFHRFWRKRLDRLVNRLNLKGVPDTPYADPGMK